jgi:hypothetical protein
MADVTQLKVVMLTDGGIVGLTRSITTKGLSPGANYLNRSRDNRHIQVLIEIHATMCLNLSTTTILKGQLKQFQCKNKDCGQTIAQPKIDDFTNDKFVLSIDVKFYCRFCGKVHFATLANEKPKISCKIKPK